MNRHLVISSDGHAGLPPERYRDYLDPKFREAFDLALPIQLERTAQMEKLFLVDEINAGWRQGRERALSGAWDSDARNEVIDSDGVAAEVLFPDGITERNAPPFGAGFSMPSEEVVPELQWAGSRAHNRWMAEFVQMAPERRVGLACVPVLWDISEAVREVHWARENGLRGVILPAMWGAQPPYHHPRYDPFWAACAELKMPVHFHSGLAPTQDYFGAAAAGEAPTAPPPGAMGIYVTEVVWYVVRPLTFMLWGGVFERHPTLGVAITEGTTIWVPEYLHLLEQRYAETHYSQKLGDYRSHLSMSPVDYFRRNVRLGASCMPRREAELRAEIGLSNIMWGTDYPHPEGSWPHTREQMINAFCGLPEAEVAAMLGGNAAAFYGLDVEKLAPIAARIGPEKSAFQRGAQGAP
ncbi:MAG: amidohydrolase family protein [Deltaproteobacteria bacterium]|nr:amidohydrolase family protein [Deltaproteobacteria bacterium]